MTPQDRQCVNELLEAASISGASFEVAARSICEEMRHLTAGEVEETCRLHSEELHLSVGSDLGFKVGRAFMNALY